MNCQIEFTDTAKADLREIAIHIAEFSKDRNLAIRFVKELQEKTKILEQFPERGAVKGHIGGFIPGDLYGTEAGHVQDGADGVGAVEGGGHEIPPVVSFAIGDLGPDGGAVVDVFALTVHDVADLTGSVSAPHLKGMRHIAVIFGISVDKTGFLNGFDQFNRLCHRFARSTSERTCLPARIHLMA
mgnify:CR=1 FL=1